MQATKPYVIGSKVFCSDQECGRLSRVVIDPVARRLTHLVVEPANHPEEARLVPIGLANQDVEDVEDVETIRLRCDRARFEALEPAQITEFLPAPADELGYPADRSLWLPYFPLAGTAGPAVGAMFPAAATDPPTVTYERVPTGEVQVRRGQAVDATDGEIGKVQGLVIDPSDHQVTHVLLSEGHLWGKKQVAVPIRNIIDVHQGVRLNLSKDEIRDLPPVDLAQFG